MTAAPKPARRFDLYGDNALAYRSREPEVLLAGAAGTGKSLMWLAKILTLCDRYPGCKVLIVRKTRESLTDTILVTWERDVLGYDHPVLLNSPTLRRVRQSYRFPNRSEVVVGGMDKPDKVLSSDWHFIYCPEATDLELGDWETLSGRLGRDGLVPFDQIAGDCNPTSPHHWLYQRHLNGLLKLHTSLHQDNPAYYDRAAKEWTAQGKKYLARLDRMTGSRRARFRFGKWAVAEGLVYDYRPGPEFDEATGAVTHPGHLMPRGWAPPREWPRVWSIDWGLSAPTVLQMWAVDPDGRMYLYREVFKTLLRPDVLGRWARDRIQAGEEPVPRAVVCDHDEKNKKQFEAASGLGLALADKADRDKGIETTQERFDLAEDGRPRIFFCEGARDHEPDQRLLDEGRPTSTVAEIASYTWDEDMLKDEPIAENDHGCFVAGTMVETDRGPVAIEAVRPGDRVLTRSGYKRVLDAGCTNPSAEVQTMFLSDGRSLTATPDHPVWVEGRAEFVRLDSLRIGDNLMVRPGDPPVRALLCSGYSPDPCAVYNLTVEGAHEFFANGVLVHNCDSMRYAERHISAAYPKPQAAIATRRPPPGDPFGRLGKDTWA